MVADVCLLQNGADGKMIRMVLDQLAKSKFLQSTDIMSIIKFVVPVYPSLVNSTQELILLLLSKSLDLLAQLISFTSSFRKDQPEVKIYKRVLAELLLRHHDCLKNYVENFCKNTTEKHTLNAVLFGSKLFNTLASDVDIVWYLDALANQWAHLLDMPLIFFESPKFGEFLVTMFKLHPTLSLEILLGGLFLRNKNNYERFKVLVLSSSSLHQQTVIRNFLLPYLNLKINHSNYRSAYVVLTDFPLTGSMDANTILRTKSFLFQHILLLRQQKSENEKLVAQLMNKFGEVHEAVDHNICQLLTVIFRSRMGDQERHKLSNDSRFLNSITERLKNQDSLVIERTMFIAKILTNGEVKYESDFTIEIPNLQITGTGQVDNDLLNSINQSNDNPQQIVSVSSNFRRLDVNRDSDDEEETSSTSNEREIVFIKDLLRAFEKIGKSNNIDIVPLFKLTVKLVRQKKDLPREVNFYSSNLITNVSCASNNHEEKRFEEWRINALISLIVVVPEKVTDLMKILFNKELSLQQRMSILTSISFSARELRGYNDRSFAKPQFDFPTKRLPWDVEGLEAHELVALPTNFNSVISPGIDVWKSKKLQIKPLQSTQNLFKPHVGKFFYPLAHTWLNGINLGTYDRLFKTHYLTTLVIIYECAFPVHDYETITQLMSQVMVDATKEGIKMPDGINFHAINS